MAALRRTEALKKVRFTRLLVLEGKSHREQILVPELGAGAYVSMRPLTDSEFVEVQKIILGDLSANKLPELDQKIQDIVEREQRGKYLALSFALSVEGEQWTPEDVGALPPGVPDHLYSQLALMSGFPRPAEPSAERTEELG